MVTQPKMISPSSDIELLTSDEVADLFKVCKRTVERLNLPYVKVGRLRRYRRSDVVDYLEAKVDAA